MELKPLKKSMDKKGQVDNLVNGILAVILFGIILVFGTVVMQELRDTQTAGTEAHTAANDTLVAVGNTSGFVPLIVLAIVISVVLGLIIAGFALRGRTR